MDLSEFISIYPEFSDPIIFSPDIIEMIISDACNEINESKWGIYYNRGVAALVAHLLTIRKLASNGNRADVVSFSGEGLSVEYAGRFKGSSNFDPYDKTEYGSEYKRLRSIVAYMQPRQTVSQNV